jgi:hypothetical protein
MQAQLGRPSDSQAAREGTAAHWVAEQILTGCVPGAVAPNGVEITSDMLEGAHMYATGILSRYHVSALSLEAKVHASQIHADLKGTCDLYVYDKARKLLIVRDFKYGFGIVEAFENWQLICYTAGIMQRVGVVNDHDLTVRMEVCQPRAPHSKGPERVWQVKASDLRGYINRLHSAAHEALSDSPKARTGPHCVYCTARHACSALSKSTKTILDFILQEAPDELTPEALSSEIVILRHAAELIKYRLTGIEAEAMALIKSGTYLPGWGIAAGAGRQVWSKPLEEICAMGALMDINLRKEEAITPKQAISKD